MSCKLHRKFIKIADVSIDFLLNFEIGAVNWQWNHLCFCFLNVALMVYFWRVVEILAKYDWHPSRIASEIVWIWNIVELSQSLQNYDAMLSLVPSRYPTKLSFRRTAGLSRNLNSLRALNRFSDNGTNVFRCSVIYIIVLLYLTVDF